MKVQAGAEVLETERWLRLSRLSGPAPSSTDLLAQPNAGTTSPPAASSPAHRNREDS